jgi:hypothetical protein
MAMRDSQLLEFVNTIKSLSFIGPLKPWLLCILVVSLCLSARARSAAITTVSVLDGSWKSECQNGKRADMHIERNSSLLLEAYYNDSHCDRAVFEIETTGKISYPESKEPTFTHSAFPVDYEYQQITITPRQKDAVTQFNNNQFCGIKSWSLDTPQIVTGGFCRFIEGARPIPIPLAGQKRYGLFRIDEPWLYFGQNNAEEDSSAPERRPSRLQNQPFAKRSPWPKF